VDVLFSGSAGLSDSIILIFLLRDERGRWEEREGGEGRKK
jgi:hypothetical protein